MYFYFDASSAFTSIRLGGYTQQWIGIRCKQCTDKMFRHLQVPIVLIISGYIILSILLS